MSVFDKPHRPSALNDRFASRKGEWLTVHELVREARIQGMPWRWMTEDSGLSGMNRYVLSVLRGAGRPYHLVRVDAAGDARWDGWHVSDEPIQWVCKTHIGLKAHDGQLTRPDGWPHLQRPQPDVALFPADLSWQVLKEDGEQLEVSNPSRPSTYTVPAKLLQWREMPPTPLELAAEDQLISGAWGDGHSIGKGSAEEILKRGRAIRYTLDADDRVIAIEPLREWDRLWHRSFDLSAAQALAACHAGLLDPEDGPPSQQEFRQHYTDCTRGDSRAEVEAFTWLFWDENRRIEACMRDIQVVRMLDRHGGQ